VQALPDGVFTFKEASADKLVYESKINDHHQWQYHRENGLTKIGVKTEKGMETEILRVLEGQVEMNSLMNKAYMKANFPNTTVITGINFYPYELNFKFWKQKIENFLALAFIPAALCMGLPVFLYQIVLEKEKKLI